MINTPLLDTDHYLIELLTRVGEKQESHAAFEYQTPSLKTELLK